MSEQDKVVSGAPAAAGGADDIGELKVKRGGGGIAMAIILILLIGGGAGAALWYFVLRDDPSVAHDAFRREVLGVAHVQYYDTFWNCALSAPLSDFRNNVQLMQRIQRNSAAGDARRYGEHLQKSASCLPLLGEGVPAYRALKSNAKTPAEYGELLDELAANIEEVQRTWTGFASYAVGAEKRADLRSRIKARGEAYAGYEGAVEQNDAARRTKYLANAVGYHQYLTCALGHVSYTSFEGNPEGDDAAHYKLVAHLDERCRSDRDAFVERLTETCGEKLYPTSPPAPTPEFEEAVGHWVKQGGDYGSALPLIECLEEDQTARTTKLAEAITKAWYDYTKSYRQIYELSKSQTTSIFDRGRYGGSEAAGSDPAPPEPIEGE